MLAAGTLVLTWLSGTSNESSIETAGEQCIYRARRRSRVGKDGVLNYCQVIVRCCRTAAAAAAATAVNDFS